MVHMRAYSAYRQSIWDSFVMSHVHCFSSSSVVTIGFDVASYTITESATSVSVSVSVQSGSLARDVVLTVETMDGTATGEPLSHAQILYIHVSFMCYHFTLQLHLTT